jgi:hypothetical protein
MVSSARTGLYKPNCTNLSFRFRSMKTLDAHRRYPRSAGCCGRIAPGHSTWGLSHPCLSCRAQFCSTGCNRFSGPPLCPVLVCSLACSGLWSMSTAHWFVFLFNGCYGLPSDIGRCHGFPFLSGDVMLDMWCHRKWSRFCVSPGVARVREGYADLFRLLYRTFYCLRYARAPRKCSTFYMRLFASLEFRSCCHVPL